MHPRSLPPKYITVNGVMKINPAYTAAKASQGEHTTVARPEKALAIISTADEMMAASKVMSEDKSIQKPIQVSASSAASTEIIQDPEFLEKFKAPKPIDGGELIDKLYAVFAKYEVPIGLINKLLKLAEYRLNFIIDDSGSMNELSDLTFRQATSYVQSKSKSLDARMTRWQEAEDRLHILIELIGYIPTNGIEINYLNESDSSGTKKASLILNQTGKSPEEFIAESHKQISRFFSVTPRQSTPIYTKLNKVLAETKEAVMHYLFTDGEPSDATELQVAKLISERKDPEKNPITLISCSDRDTVWMKDVEEVAKYVSELDDFSSECKEVLNDQGPVFPYSKGMWLMCNLVAAICPTDLDAIDESIPFTKCTLDNLLGRKLNPSEYKEYFINNPNAKKFTSLYSQFMREDIEAFVIIEAIRKVSGISDAKDFTPGAIAAYAATLSASGASFTLPSHAATGESKEAPPPPSYSEAMASSTTFFSGSTSSTSRSGTPSVEHKSVTVARP